MTSSFMPLENLEDLARKFGIGPYARKPEGNTQPPDTKRNDSLVFRIEESDDFYTLHGVKIRDEIVSIAWTKQLLDEGKSHAQDAWVEQTKDQETKVPSAPVYIASFIALHEHKDSDDAEQRSLVENMRKMFETDFDPQKPWMMTSTRITYAKQGQDIIKQDYKYDTEREIKQDITGPNGWIRASASGLENITQAVLEIDDKEHIEKASEWITTKKPYLWRLESKPQQDEERAVVLGRVIGNVRFGISCDGGVSNDWPARGVVVSSSREKSSIGNGV